MKLFFITALLIASQLTMIGCSGPERRTERRETVYTSDDPDATRREVVYRSDDPDTSRREVVYETTDPDGNRGVVVDDDRYANGTATNNYYSETRYVENPERRPRGIIGSTFYFIGQVIAFPFKLIGGLIDLIF